MIERPNILPAADCPSEKSGTVLPPAPGVTSATTGAPVGALRDRVSDLGDRLQKAFVRSMTRGPEELGISPEQAAVLNQGCRDAMLLDAAAKVDEARCHLLLLVPSNPPEHETMEAVRACLRDAAITLRALCPEVCACGKFRGPCESPEACPDRSPS